MGQASRFQGIDALRGIAALAVVLFHFNEPYADLDDLYHRVVKYGWLGVTIFFVISGYCVARAGEKESALTFYIRRAARIMVPYWASLLLVCLVIGIRVWHTGTNDVTVFTREVTDMFLTVFLLTDPVTSVPTINWVYWSLSYELAFYLILGLCLLWRAEVMLILVTLGSLVFSFFPMTYWGAFCLGAAVFYCDRKLSIITVFLLLGCLLQTYWRLSIEQWIAAILSALLVWGSLRIPRSQLLQPIAFLGKISYSLYLIHVPIACYFLARYLPVTGERETLSSIGQDVVYLLITVAVTYVFYICVEKTSHRWARRLSGPHIKGDHDSG